MSSNENFKRYLENEAPKLSSAAIARLDERVGEALAGATRRRRWLPRAALVAAPSLIAILLAIVLLRPGGKGSEYLLLTEDELVTSLQDWSDPDEALDVLYTADLSDYADTKNWKETDWEAFQQDLEDFQLADNGGER